jgi:hypothetical protein
VHEEISGNGTLHGMSNVVDYERIAIAPSVQISDRGAPVGEEFASQSVARERLCGEAIGVLNARKKKRLIEQRTPAHALIRGMRRQNITAVGLIAVGRRQRQSGTEQAHKGGEISHRAGSACNQGTFVSLALQL